jgi:hypothetical protein
MRIPLFPLHAVLFPGGVLPLRVFEPRYMDMVRECMKGSSPFGAVLINQGSEVGAPASPERAGTLARITAWDMPQLGLLHLRAVGGERFRITDLQAQNDGLQVADVELIPADTDLPLLEDHRPCADLLRRIIADTEAKRAGEADSATDPLHAPPFEPPYRFDSTLWVGNRLCEFMPVPLLAKQRLMELQDAASRLELVRKFLQQHGVLK